MGSPSYSTTGTGPKHEQVFTSEVSAGGKVLGSGTASTKREAERIAAEAALVRLDKDEAAAAKAKAKPKAPARSMARSATPAKAGTKPRAGTTKAAGKQAGRPATTEARPPEPAEPVQVETGQHEDELPFDGPWPVFESVLSQSLVIAQTRVPSRLTGGEAREAIRDFTLELYKDLLRNLGEVVEIDDEEEPEQA
jgi:hypothetical protein